MNIFAEYFMRDSAAQYMRKKLQLSRHWRCVDCCVVSTPPDMHRVDFFFEYNEKPLVIIIGVVDRCVALQLGFRLPNGHVRTALELDELTPDGELRLDDLQRIDWQAALMHLYEAYQQRWTAEQALAEARAQHSAARDKCRAQVTAVKAMLAEELISEEVEEGQDDSHRELVSEEVEEGQDDSHWEFI